MNKQNQNSAVMKFFDDVLNADAEEVSVCSVHEKYAHNTDASEWLRMVAEYYQNSTNLSKEIDLRFVEHREKPGFDNWIVTDLVLYKLNGNGTNRQNAQ